MIDLVDNLNRWFCYFIFYFFALDFPVHDGGLSGCVREECVRRRGLSIKSVEERGTSGAKPKHPIQASMHLPRSAKKTPGIRNTWLIE